MRPVIAGFLFTCWCAVSGCTPAVTAEAPIERAAPVAAPSQIIVKFRDPAFDPSGQGYLTELSGVVGATLEYVRPMSGGAHVLRIRDPWSIPELMRIVDAIARRPEVAFAELDRRKQHMP